MKKLTTKEFINKAIKVHGNKYDYSLVDYKTTRIKVKIICFIHGIFEQIPNKHLNGRGCIKCSGNKILTTKEFINKAIKVHGNKYDYSLVDYKNAKTRIIIICSAHGSFEQTPECHLRGNGCLKCSAIKRGKKLKLTTKEFINKAIKVHGNKYDYSLVEYKNNYNKIKIICSKHGMFEQMPYVHIKPCGCPKCSIEMNTLKQTLTTKEFINRAIKIHNNKYNYSKTEYINNQIKIKITCPEHGIFEQKPHDHLQGSGCPKCSHHVSSYEKEIHLFFDKLNVEYETSNRSILEGKELDIVIPSFNLAIEFNGLYWHSEQMLKNRNVNPIQYHKQKYLGCKENGYQLLSIFEPEWLFKKEIIKSIICAKLNIYKTKIGARKCKIKQLVTLDARSFFNENHIQGFSNGSIYYGLYYEKQLVSAITFRKSKSSFDLVRFVNKKNTLVMGAFSKLLKYFINNNLFESIYTFADLRYFDGNVYLKNGFKFVHEITSSYFYFKNNKELLHKRGFQKKILKEKFENYDPGLTEYQNCLNNGYDRIWDCGKLKYKMKYIVPFKKL